MQPALKLSVNGRDLAAKVTSLTLTDNSELEADTINVVISDVANAIKLPSKGAVIECWLGWVKNQVPQLTYKGKFIADSIGYDINPREITINASSADFRGDIGKIETRSYEQKSLGTIASDIASAHQLAAKISPLYNEQVLEHIDQVGESDAISLSLVLQHGNPNWLAQSPVVVTGIKSSIDSITWVSHSVTHRVDTNGFVTETVLEQKNT